jgi:putative ATPase
VFPAQGGQPESLFDAAEDSAAQAAAPLAVRMRPRTLDEVIGQRHLTRDGSPLRKLADTDAGLSVILWGPPGTGKTTLAYVVSQVTRRHFVELSAVSAGVKDVRAAVQAARRDLGLTGVQTVLFIDEVHRFNKAQQDALLPAVEDGLITLIGATTENPYFEVNSALLSRSRVYELQALSSEDVRQLLDRAVTRGELGDSVRIDAEALEYAAGWTQGDARAALNALELAAETAGTDGRVTLEGIADALQRRTISYDRQADNHYDTISAWIKATRGSDPDASLYYLAVMLEGGEDPRFIVRRMVILASEDIGNADPHALVVATAAAAAVEHVGLPECEFALAQAAIYLSMAPKSDGVKRAIGRARGYVREYGAVAPPAYLRSSTRSGGEYDYPHALPGHVSAQELLPETVAGARFYEPDDAEAALRERLAEIRRARGLEP